MTIIKCKMCGGDIELSADKTFGMCEYCGSTMTLPKIDDEQRAAAFNRGNHFRRIGEFDKALAVYEHIVQEDNTDAEAHWCCALCRFGIEYVEDPTTFEYIPTCHRASFDSFLQDIDYLAALEYSDGITRRQYQKDGSKIAEVQKGILATSQNEEPFDVFICYKESDDNGNRTKDSTLAQDIYYQLTEQGRRVFFARITLEDKAGAQYEPYIFSALNSAKVMIVVGTKPEYFNAVWVKNEWSRFLSLIKKDRTKLLLPCYRDMDPYDLPEQLGVLQSYDMSKIGFIQDLIRGVNKVLAVDKKTEPVKENVTAQQSIVGSNAVAMLKRGNMALEDGDWKGADDFFEKVLNQDAECAEAYMGKVLAANQCKTLESYVQRLLSQYEGVTVQKIPAMEANAARIDAAVKRYAVPNYLNGGDIKRLYDYNLFYTSVLASRKSQCQRAKQAFDTDKLISRALRFATGDYKVKLEKARKAYFDTLDVWVATAQKEDEESIAKIKGEYAEHLDNADQEAAQLHQNAMGRCEQDYQHACKMQTEAKTEDAFRRAVDIFARMRDYKDSRTRETGCYDEIEQLKAREKAEAEAAAERRRLAAEKAAAKKKAVIIIMTTTAAAILAITLLMIKVVIPMWNYEKAETLLVAGDYGGAAEVFEALGDYKDAAEKALKTRYFQAETSLTDGDLVDAARQFKKAIGYQDAKERYFALWGTMGAVIAAGKNHTAVLKSNGTVVAVGDNTYGQCNVSEWTEIIAIAAGEKHTAALKSDGTVVAAGDNAYGQCDVSEWTEIIAIAAGEKHTAALKSDGTVVAVGDNTFGQCNVNEWTGVVAVSTGNYYTIGLRSDGTVVAAGNNASGQCNVSEWTDIVAVAASKNHTVGLKSDGTVVAVGSDPYGQCNVSKWTDIVAVAAGGLYTIGLKSDGTVVAVGDNTFGQCNVNEWTDIVAVAASTGHAVGLKADGTVVAVGSNLNGQCNVSEWTDIMFTSN